MNIYFACSIRGEKTDVNIIKEIVRCLENYGYVLDLVTKHIDDEDWIDKFDKHDEYIYNYDMKLLKTADIMVAEISGASLGVGYELKTTELYNIPCLCLCHTSKKPSAMISGNKYFIIHYYYTLGDIKFLIDDFMNSIKILRGLGNAKKL